MTGRLAELARRFTNLTNLEVDSVSSLIELPGSFDGQSVKLLGYSEKGDGGGGVFYWDASSVEEDNNGTILKVDSIFTGRWKRLYNSYLNVSMFGFIGDGITDDSDAIEDALKAIKDGETLIFPDFEEAKIDRNFIVDKSITIIGSSGFLKVPDNSSIWSGENARRPIFDCIKSNTIIDGLKIDINSRGNYVVENGKTIYYAISEDSIYPTGTSGISISAGRDGGDSQLVGSIVRNCVIYDASAVSIRVDGGYGSSEEWDIDSESFNEGALVYNNKIYFGQRSGINFIGGVRYAKVFNNTFINPYHSPLRFYRQVFSCEIFKNKIIIEHDKLDVTKYTSSDSTGVRIDIRIGHGDRAPGTVHNCSIEDNTIEYVGDGSNIVSSGDSIRVEKGNSGIGIKNNKIKGIGTTGHGIFVNSEEGFEASDIIINGNELSNVGRYGILLRSVTGGQSIVSSNKLHGWNLSDGSTEFAVRVESCDNILIESNTINRSPATPVNNSRGISISAVNGDNITIGLNYSDTLVYTQLIPFPLSRAKMVGGLFSSDGKFHLFNSGLRVVTGKTPLLVTDDERSTSFRSDTTQVQFPSAMPAGSVLNIATSVEVESGDPHGVRISSFDRFGFNANLYGDTAISSGYIHYIVYAYAP